MHRHRLVATEAPLEAPRPTVVVEAGADSGRIQSAIDHLAALGGGVLQLSAGEYRLRNALHLRSHISLLGQGPETVLIKEPSFTTPLAEDMDWYEWTVTVEDASEFRVGDGLALHSKDPHGKGENVTKHTILAIDGHTLLLDTQPRRNHWTTHEAAASSLFPLITANWERDLTIAGLALDGNRAANDYFNGNYGGCIFLQDCDSVSISDVEARDYHGDGFSWQVCHDVTVENCRLSGHANNGLHPGSGSQRPLMRGNHISACGVGLFWCWGVKYGLAENNVIESSATCGISIGHRDTDNVMRSNRILNSGRASIFVRPDPPARAAHRNRIVDNEIINAGTDTEPGYGIHVAGPARDLAITGNRIIDETGTMAADIHLDHEDAQASIEGNAFQRGTAS